MKNLCIIHKLLCSSAPLLLCSSAPLILCTSALAQAPVQIPVPQLLRVPAPPRQRSPSVPASSVKPVEPAEPGTNGDDTPAEEEETDGVAKPNGVREPGTTGNPLREPTIDLDRLVENGISDDLWTEMKGDLPCVESTKECIVQLQNKATQANPLLSDIQKAIDEINVKIEDAKARNKKQVLLSVLSPGVRILLAPATGTSSTSTVNGQAVTTTKPGTTGIIGNLLSVFSGPVGLVDRLLNAVGIPLLERTIGGGTADTVRNSIAIDELAIKTAELTRGKAELANKIKEQTALATLDLDDARREFQIARQIARRERSRTAIIKLQYRFGQGSNESYLQTLNNLDTKEASVYRAWATFRGKLERLKLLVIGVEDDE